MDNLKLAKDNLSQGQYSCVVVRDNEIIYTSYDKGVKPLFQSLIKDQDSLREGYLADKVIGKAAALLALNGGIKAIYTEIISQSGLELLKNKGMEVQYDRLVPYIKNREGSDKCPMEKLVECIDEPEQGFEAIKGFIAERMAAITVI
jgi:hypothetical protein